MFSNLWGKTQAQKEQALLTSWSAQDDIDTQRQSITTRLQQVYMSDDIADYNQVLIDIHNEKFNGRVAVCGGVLVFEQGILKAFNTI